jgi:hypothetical protein
MVYIILILLIIAAVLTYIKFDLKKKKALRLETIRGFWGRPKDDYLNFDLIERYFLAADTNGYHRLTAQTIKDLDFNEVFGFIDRTTSRVGQQYLFDKFMHPDNDIGKLGKLNFDANFFSENLVVREQVQMELFRLNSNDAYFVTSLLRDKLLIRPRRYLLFFLSVISLVVLLTLSFKYPFLIIVSIVPITLNIFIHYWNKGNVLQFVTSFPQLALLINVCRNVSKLHLRFKDQAVEEAIFSLRYFRQKAKLLGFFKSQGIQDDLSQLMEYFIELLKAIFLVEVFTVFHLAKSAEGNRENILRLFRYVGEIDCAISVASLRAGPAKACVPEFIEGSKGLHATAIYHPLITNCVKNDIEVLSKGVLITGSNMAGKTSFLRTVILNSILAQTINTCFADRFRSPILKQFSSIRIEDNLFEAKSYYYEEVATLATLIHEVGSQYQNIFVLDEIFKGTNTIERIASAKAILSYLNDGKSMVFVSTHDLELCSMLKDEYDIYHFSETVEDNNLHFDYKLKPGQVNTRNAITLLELSDYPKQLTDEARHLARMLDRK